MTEEEKQLIETAKTIIERNEERQFIEYAKNISQIDNKVVNNENAYEISGLAIAALVLGIISLFGYPIICGILSVTLGLLVISSNKKGRNMACAGIITGACGMAAYFLLLGR